MNVVVNNLLTHYEVQGSGRAVVLLHGWGDNLKGLSGLQNSIADKFKVYSLDLPGFGTTQAPETVWDLDNFSEFVRDFLAKIEVQPYAIIGHSNGGAMAIRGIALKQIEPQKLVLLAASGIRSNQSGKRAILKVIAKTGKVATVWMPKATRLKLRKKLYGVAGSDLLVVEHLQETFKKTVRQDVQADAAKITIPALLIYADNDEAVPLAYGKTYHSLIKNSELKVIGGASHFVHLDEPERVTSLIKDFLK